MTTPPSLIINSVFVEPAQHWAESTDRTLRREPTRRPLPVTKSSTPARTRDARCLFRWRTARREAGFQLGKVQAGLDPDDWKPFDDVGRGTREIRIRGAAGIFRVMYVAKFEEAIYVLHSFQKRTETTCNRDKEIAKTRYRAIGAGKEVNGMNKIDTRIGHVTKPGANLFAELGFSPKDAQRLQAQSRIVVSTTSV